MISGTANEAAVSRVLAGKFLAVDFRANIGEALRLASIRNRNCHLDNDLQHSAGTLKGLLKIFEGLPNLPAD